MASKYAAAAESRRPAKTVTGAGQMSDNSGEYTLAAALALNDIVFLCKLPARHVIVDFLMDSDDLDTNGTPTIALDVGVYETDETIVDADALIDGSAVGEAGGLARMDAVAGRKLAPSDNDRLIGVLVQTGPATGATSGTIQGTLLSRVAGQDD